MGENLQEKRFYKNNIISMIENLNIEQLACVFVIVSSFVKESNNE